MADRRPRTGSDRLGRLRDVGPDGGRRGVSALDRALASGPARKAIGAVGRRIGAEQEHGLCLLLQRRRLALPTLELGSLTADGTTPPVTIREPPTGPWATPLNDVVQLLKIVSMAQPRLALEIGSYRGHTASAIAEHLPDGGRLVALDIDERHGAAYEGAPVAARIDRRVGTLRSGALDEFGDAAFDFVFIDAAHDYESVRRDTEAALPLLAPSGWLVWHDYANWGGYSGLCGVADHLVELSGAGMPVAHVAGSSLALHRPVWRSPSGAEVFAAATAPRGGAAPLDDDWGRSTDRG